MRDDHSSMVINLPVDEAEKILKYGLQVERSGSGDIVYGQVPVDVIKLNKQQCCCS